MAMSTAEVKTTPELLAPVSRLAKFGSLAVEGEGDSDLYWPAELISVEHAEALIDRGHAVAPDGVQALATLFPTRAGLDEALRLSTGEPAKSDSIVAVIGSRKWEMLPPEVSAPLIGLLLTENSTLRLAAALASVRRQAVSSPSLLVETLGGAVPGCIAGGLSGDALVGAPAFEFGKVPPALRRLVNLVEPRRYLLDVRLEEGSALIFEWGVKTPRLVAPLTISAIAEAIKCAVPSVVDSAEWRVLTSPRESSEKAHLGGDAA